MPWHELLLHAPLYPERDAVDRLPGAGRSPRHGRLAADSSQQVGSGHIRPPAGHAATKEWVDVRAGTSRPAGAELASSRGYSSLPASPRREHPRRSRRTMLPDQGLHSRKAAWDDSVQASGGPQQITGRAGAERWTDENRPQSAPQRSPRSAAGIPRSVVTSIKGGTERPELLSS